MAYYSFVPSRQGTSYMGGSGLGNWLSGMGGAIVGGMETGINLNNALREMQDMNAISPYAVSAAQAGLTNQRISSLYGAVGNQGRLGELLGRMRTPENQQMGVPQPGQNLDASQPLTGDQLLWSLGQAFGRSAVASNSPLDQSGISSVASLLRMPQYQYNNSFNVGGM